MANRINRDRSEFDRGLGFFDAVYGFAITLLVANIDLPPAAAWVNLQTLSAPEFSSQVLGFVVSFAVIAVFWKVNTDLVGRLRGMDGAVIAANLVTAALIVFIAFTTQGLSDPGLSELPLPTAVYALNVGAAILSQAIMFEVARARGLVEDDVPQAARWASRLDVLAKVLVFVVSVPIAYLVGPSWAMVTWASLIVIAPLTGRWSDGVAAGAEEKPA